MRRLAIPMVLSAFPLKSELLPIRTYTTADGLAADERTPSRKSGSLTRPW
jgi:hypothetical protein